MEISINIANGDRLASLTTVDGALSPTCCRLLNRAAAFSTLKHNTQQLLRSSSVPSSRSFRGKPPASSSSRLPSIIIAIIDYPRIRITIHSVRVTPTANTSLHEQKEKKKKMPRAPSSRLSIRYPSTWF